MAWSPSGPQPVSLIALHMVTPQRGWGLTNREVLRTDDGGRHWTVVHRAGRSTRFQGDAFTATSTTAATLVVGLHSNPHVIQSTVLTTQDAGRHWRRSSSIRGQAGSPSDISWITPRRAWILTGEGAAAGSVATDIYRTTDGGLHWAIMSFNRLSTHSTHSLPACNGFEGIAFKNVSTGWAAGTCGPAPQDLLLYRTRDGGRTWYQQHLQSPVQRPTSVWNVAPPVFGNGMAALPVQSSPCNCLTLYTLGSGGATWTPTAWLHDRPFALPPLAMLDPLHVWAWVRGRLHVTSDGGRHWTTLPRSVSLAGADFAFVTPRSGFALETGSERRHAFLLRTDDGGRTWLLVTTQGAA
jgi:photosystem II stability/assembly factor-like uncharacterized protein